MLTISKTILIFVLILNSVNATNIHFKNKLYCGQSSLIAELSITAVKPFYIMKNQKEIWKDIVEYKGVYLVSNLGNVKSLRFGKEKIMKQTDNGYGYLCVILSESGQAKIRTVHQLVAEVFLNHVPNGRMIVVNHKNFIRTDNRLENLEIVTARENCNRKHLKSSSEYVGVSWYKPYKKWKAQIRINGKKIYLGLFINELEASKAYQSALNNL